MPYPLCTEIPSDSQNILMRMIMWVSLCNFILRNIIQKLFHNGWTSVNVHFWEQLPLYDALETCFFKIGNCFFLKFSFPLFKHWICFLCSIVLLFQQSTTAHLKKISKIWKVMDAVSKNTLNGYSRKLQNSLATLLSFKFLQLKIQL